jgi:hypothetical protein
VLDAELVERPRQSSDGGNAADDSEDVSRPGDI